MNASEPSPRYIGVVGGAACDEAMARVAEEVGRLLAESGAVVVCGGLGGVMEAACKGAREAGGTSIAILPGHDRRDANPYASFAFPTGLGEARNVVLVRSADAVIAVGGEFGTLSEIALALKLGIPVIGIGTWEVSRDGFGRDAIHRVRDAAQAVNAALC